MKQTRRKEEEIRVTFQTASEAEEPFYPIPQFTSRREFFLLFPDRSLTFFTPSPQMSSLLFCPPGRRQTLSLLTSCESNQPQEPRSLTLFSFTFSSSCQVREPLNSIDRLHACRAPLLLLHILVTSCPSYTCLVLLTCVCWTRQTEGEREREFTSQEFLNICSSTTSDSSSCPLIILH